MPPTLIVDDRAPLVKAFVRLVEDAAADAVSARGRFVMAVTGGGDAQALLPALLEAQVDWRRAEVFWGDERAVPPSDPDSNYGQIRPQWLDHSAIPAEQVHPMRGDAPDLEAAAREYAATLADRLGPSLALDAFVLGMGPDGHVCSIFPGHPLAVERDRTVAAIYDSPKPPPQRLTLTLPMIERARLVVVTALSPSKGPALDAALHDTTSTLPIAQVVRRAARVVVLRAASHQSGEQ
jgi:6-phosphogluconolactonase